MPIRSIIHCTVNFCLQQHKYSKAKVLQLLVEVICRHSGLNTTDSVVISMVVINNKVVLLVPQDSHLVLEVPMLVLLVLLLQVAQLKMLVVVESARLVSCLYDVLYGMFYGVT